MKTLMKFGAEWCAPCKTVEAKLVEAGLTKSDESYEFKNIDVEENDDLVEKFNIRNVPVLILLENGTEVRRWIGNSTNFIEEIKNELQKE